MRPKGIPDTYKGKAYRHDWAYNDERGEPLGYVVRFDDGAGSKDIVPYFNQSGGNWQAGAPAEPRPLFGLEVLAQAKPDRAVFIVEGEKTAAALQSIGLVAVTSLGGSNAPNKTDWKPIESFRRVFLLPDNDEAGQGYDKSVAAILMSHLPAHDIKIVHLPDLPAAGDACDFIKAFIDDAFIDWDEFAPVPDRDNVLTAFNQAVKTCAQALPADWLAETAPQAVNSWPDPVLFDDAPLPAWPGDVFPDVIQRFVTELAASTETPPELAALLVLAAISAACQGKYRLRVKRDYFEPLNIWTLCALPPGSRKTGVQSAATAPLTQWERDQREIMTPVINAAKSDHATISEQIKELRSKAKKASGEEFTQLKKEIAEIEAQLPAIPTLPQVWAQDVTPEKLGAMMAENNERMAILSDEPGIFGILAGRYSGGDPNLDLFLQGHAGAAVKVDRGSRPSIFLQSPCLTLGLSPQPEVIRGLTNDKTFRGRGLLGRFLYALPQSNLGYRTLTAPALSENTQGHYERTLTTLLNHESAIDDKGEQIAHILKLSHESQDALHQYALTIEHSMRAGGRFEHITDWAGKLAGALARIAALLHCTRYANDRPQDHEISTQDMQAALRMGDCLSAHALTAFDLMGADPALDGARHVMKWIERKGDPEFSFRDCHYAHKGRYRRAEELEPVIDVLTERHYIRPKVMKLVQGRPPRIYAINPAILKMKG